MEIKDIFVTPFILLVFTPFVMAFSSSQKDPFDKKLVYFGFLGKFFGAISIGLIYQFYYGGGDTFNFYNQSKVIWQAALENPFNYFKLAFSSGQSIPGLETYISKMYWYRDASSFFVAKCSAFFGIFTLNSFLANSLFFAAWSFSGSWAIYRVFSDRYPNLELEAALTAFFIPSCMIWGSGLFKDTLTFGAIGWLFFGFYRVFIVKEISRGPIIGLILGLYVLYVVKIYILLSFIPCLLGWIVLDNLKSVRSGVVKAFLAPLFFAVAGILGFFTMDQMVEDNVQYDLDNIAITSQTTAYDIAFWTGKGAGSTYYLGELDGTLSGMLGLAPQGIVVTLFRPWIWEVSNPLMLISALESLALLILTIIVLIRAKIFGVISYIRNDPFLVCCLSFSIVFAIGVGVSSFNFGSLARYKIPLLPFYTFSFFVLNSYVSYYSKRKMA
jgi:hypothetical protein